MELTNYLDCLSCLTFNVLLFFCYLGVSENFGDVIKAEKYSGTWSAEL